MNLNVYKIICQWLLGSLLFLTGLSNLAAQEMQAEFVFPLHPEHNHAPGIVACANGDLVASWYRGSGERKADDVAVYGARLRAGDTKWSEAFLMVDTPEFPDCNTTMMIDSQGNLRLFWPIVIANSWESCLTSYIASDDYLSDGPPKWKSHDIIWMKPDDFGAEARAALDMVVKLFQGVLSAEQRAEIESVNEKLGDKLYQRLGWQPRCKPTVLSNGRILLPLYSDTFSMSTMAISDDGGTHWFAGKPMMGFGNIQPAVLRKDDGTLVAYMRENGITGQIRVAESIDNGFSWGPVGESELPNPGSGLDGVRLANGHWVLIYNDTQEGRNSLAVSLSIDEGKTWGWTRHLENHPTGSYHYPAIIQANNGRIHAIYSYFVDEGKTMKHAAFDEAWIRNVE